MRKNIVYGFIFIFALVYAAPVSAQNAGPAASPNPVKVEARPGEGFSYPYFLYVPPAPAEAKNLKARQTILVLPNNTGKISDDLKVHEDSVKRRSGQAVEVAAKVGVIVLVPVFPRPETDWKIYTHALDRDSLLTDKKEYGRFDLQLLAMIDHARKGLEKQKIKTDKRVMMMGFSASGMFSNRFAFLHPGRVKAAAVGSPGGWPIAPAETYKEKILRYPIGAGDFKKTSGKALNKGALRKVVFFVFMGDKDDNDSVTFTDGYDEEDKDLIFELFGKTPVERWEICKKIYEDAGLNATFKLYPDVKHTITTAMHNDLIEFLKANK